MGKAQRLVYVMALIWLALTLVTVASVGCNFKWPWSTQGDKCEACLADCDRQGIPRGQCFNCRGLGGICGEPEKK